MGTDATRAKKEAADLNSWLPITASRKAKWWYSAFHCVTAVVGPGVLGLPLVLARLGWVPGIIALGVSWSVTWYTMWLLIQLHEEAESGERFDRFTELGQHAFGEYLGFWLVIPQQIIVQVGSDVVYMVIGGKSLHKSLTLITPKADLRKTYYILIFAGVQLLLSQTPNFDSLKIVSVLAALMSLSYSFIATGASLWKGFTENHDAVHYGFRSTSSTTKIVFDIFSSLGILAFAFANHSVALEIQATIPSSLGNPSRKPMARGVAVAYAVVALCYFPVAITGFWAFGNAVEDNVLVSLEHPHWLVSAANFMVFVHVIGSYQVFAMPIFDIIESTLVTRCHFAPGLLLRLVARTAFVVFTALLGVLLPFFGGLLGFFGGIAFTSLSYIMPCAVWLKTQKPKRWSVHWILCRVSILIGVTIMILAPIGRAHDIVNSWKSYKLFQ